MSIELELGLAIDAELKRVGLECKPAAFWPYGPRPSTVLQFETDVDLHTFVVMTSPWLCVCPPTPFWAVIFPTELAGVLEYLKAIRTVA